MIKSLLKKKWLKISLTAIILMFAIAGFIMTSVFFAVKLGFTKHGGAIDFNDRYFKELSEKDYHLSSKDSSADYASEKALLLLSKIMVLDEFHPKNASLIINSFIKNQDIAVTKKMFDALNIQLLKNKLYQDKIKKIEVQKSSKKLPDSIAKINAFEWMNSEEWQVLKVSVIKDKNIIDSVAKLTGVNSRMIVSVLIGEQIRLFHSNREAFKKWMQPLKILTTETKFSLGVTGIKETTAQKTEYFLKDKKSKFYIGKKYEDLLRFYTKDTIFERYNRLTDSKNHFYSYLYAAISIRQINEQWKDEGFDISSRPEVLATLFNLGYEVSKPKPDPSVGGSRIIVNNKVYTFGSMAFEFYYSGEMSNEFPLTLKMIN